MADPNMADFYKRAARLQKSHAKGYGFEAHDTLGRSHYHRGGAPRRAILLPTLFVLATAFLLKGAILYSTGADLYNARVTDLRASDGVVEQAGGWLMQVDPVTQFVSDKIDMAVRKVRP